MVVELFTAQGCAGCPPAAKVFDGYADSKGVIALTFPVDYWDYLGWRDTFAQPMFTERQRAYDRRLKVREIYTPEIVLNGRQEAPGLDRVRIETLVQAETAKRENGPAIHFLRHATRVEVGAGRVGARGGEVWLVRYDPTSHTVKVKSGDNRGKTVQVRNVVQELSRLGAWSGSQRIYALPTAGSSGLKTVVLLQAAKGGAVLSAARG